VPPPLKLSDIITMEVIIAFIALIFIGFIIMQIRKFISVRKDKPESFSLKSFCTKLGRKQNEQSYLLKPM
tara:strand:+ start:426 stop:635 length:210 start_codon:yes stop_codon:yes gene_type:complete